MFVMGWPISFPSCAFFIVFAVSLLGVLFDFDFVLKPTTTFIFFKFWVAIGFFLFLIPKLFHYLNSIFYIIKRYIGHNAVAKVKNKPIFATHTFKKAVYAVFNYVFIGV